MAVDCIDKKMKNNVNLIKGGVQPLNQVFLQNSITFHT